MSNPNYPITGCETSGCPNKTAIVVHYGTIRRRLCSVCSHAFAEGLQASEWAHGVVRSKIKFKPVKKT